MQLAVVDAADQDIVSKGKASRAAGDKLRPQPRVNIKKMLMAFQSSQVQVKKAR